MPTQNYLWIQTRDGSPTLWSNNIGESFRSVKGAFTESWVAFVGPALNVLKRLSPEQMSKAWVGEFGLGPGTNWVLWNLSCHALGLKPQGYFVIENDPQTFAMGLERWRHEAASLSQFLTSHLLRISPDEVISCLDKFAKPLIFSSLDEAVVSSLKATVWFHDPFGYDVNPDGYSQEALSKVAKLLAPDFFGASYACNKHFKESLESMSPVTGQVTVQKVLCAHQGLKRERTEFFGGAFVPQTY